MAFYKKQSVKITALILLPVIAAIFTVAAFVVISMAKCDMNTVAWVNEEEVVLEEFLPLLSQAAGDTSSVVDARKQALEKCVRNKIQMLLMKEKGFFRDISHDALLEGLKQENIRRRQCVDNGEIIFGPVEMNFDVYYRYLADTGIKDLKELMKGKELIVSDKDIRSYYDTHKATFKKPDILELKIISSPYVIGRNTNNEMQKKAYDEICKVKSSLGLQSLFEESCLKFSPDIKVKNLILGGDNYRKDAKSLPNICMAVFGMNPGEVSEIIEDNGAYHIIKVCSKRESGYMSLDEEYTRIQKLCMDMAYDKYISMLCMNAYVKINTNVYDKTMPVK